MLVDTAHNNLVAFYDVLRSSTRILALCGSGLSAASGLPTSSSLGGFWRGYRIANLVTKRAFEMDPGVVWLYFGYKRHKCLQADPNAAHWALAALAKANENFFCLTQNVDSENLRLLDPYHRVKNIPVADLPKCPKCTAGIQRPAVVWYGEDLDKTVLEGVDDWMNKGNADLVLVIGTSAATWPAASYIMKAKRLGARLVVIKPDAETQAVLQKLEPGDFAFGRDVAECLPVLLEPVIGAFHGNGELRKE
ncbi:cell wall glucanase [Purpureocillium lavendulum]|uniref:Cell wall glucanase n=1 Tax=Purpureocillium lavendulum TaxID=1247861 RepID=A0AB34FB45_9HYPO|nr:cell wall glucanase [Purpureocillium lavendulum]